MLDRPLSLRRLLEQLESLFRSDGGVYADVKKVVPIIEERPELTDVVRFADCDDSGIHMLEAVVRSYRKRGGDVFLEGVRPGVYHMISLYGLDRMIGTDNILETDDPIGHMFHKVLHPGFCIHTCPVRVFAECQALPKELTVEEDLPEITDAPAHEVEVLTPTALKLLKEIYGWFTEGFNSGDLKEAKALLEDLSSGN